MRIFFLYKNNDFMQQLFSSSCNLLLHSAIVESIITHMGLHLVMGMVLLLMLTRMCRLHEVEASTRIAILSIIAVRNSRQDEKKNC